MNGIQHKVFSLMAASAYCIFTGDISNVSAFITAPIGAATPDLDHPAKRENKAIRAGVRTVNGIINSATLIGAGVIGAAFAVPMFFPKFASKYVGITGSIQTVFLKYIVWIVSIAAFVIMKELLARSKTFRWSVSHRGLTHTLIPIAIVYYGKVMLFKNNPILSNLINGYLVGLVSHLFIDSFNKDKCPLLFPLTKKGIGVPISVPTRNVGMCWTIIFVVGGIINFVAYWARYMK